MTIETAGSLQEKFKAGLMICGENDEGELEWIGENWNLDKVDHDYAILAGK